MKNCFTFNVIQGAVNNVLWDAYNPAYLPPGKAIQERDPIMFLSIYLSLDLSLIFYTAEMN